MSDALNIQGLRERAHKVLPAVVRGYLEGGGFQEETLRANLEDLKRISLRPRALQDVSIRSIATTMLGTPLTMPLALAPVGACGTLYPNAEACAARAALAEGVGFCLGTLSIAPIEQVAEAVRAPFWFQLYIFKDRSVSEGLIERAKKANCSALILSFDVHVRSRRYREERRGLTVPMRITPANVWDVLSSPVWATRMLHSKSHTFGNLKPHVKEAKTVFGAAAWMEDQWDPTLSAKDIVWAKQRWPGRIVAKGLLHPDDARAAADSGVDAIVVSNHGGRQVDGVLSTASALPDIVKAVGDRVEVFVDSGIRSGGDMLKMMALGAKGCWVGRAYCYGLAAAGEQGVRNAIQILRHELDEEMALCGATDIGRLPKDLIAARDESRGFRLL